MNPRWIVQLLFNGNWITESYHEHVERARFWVDATWANAYAEGRIRIVDQYNPGYTL